MLLIISSFSHETQQATFLFCIKLSYNLWYGGNMLYYMAYVKDKDQRKSKRDLFKTALQLTLLQIKGIILH